MDGTHQPSSRSWHRFFGVICGLLGVCFGAFGAQSDLQFDVFMGHDNILANNNWVPAVFEVKNDGAPIKGFIELRGDMGQAQLRRIPIDLPTGTLKRVSIPVFVSRRVYSWNARLVDERGRVRAEQPGIRPRKTLADPTLLMGAFPRTASGLPSLVQVARGSSEFQPTVARLQPPIFPDNPIVLESLDCVYLNSERAIDISDSQARALRAWLYSGGHLILAVEQVSDVTAAGWMRDLLPCEIGPIRTLDQSASLEDWLRGKPSVSALAVVSDEVFATAPIQVAGARLKDGKVVAGTEQTPFLVEARRGWGKISVLLTSPEREPLRSWRNLPVFWTQMAQVPLTCYMNPGQDQSGWSTDAVLGALIDSRQVNKLPLGWLVVLLCVYLVVIGPLDRYWLKRLNRPMLTWVTFPCYVLAFSFLIYVIGYKLRAGESELNELSVVDVISNTEMVGVKGRSFLSIYSPSNERYPVKSRQQQAAIRSETAGGWGGGDLDESSRILQVGDNYEAELFVPVWDSQLFVSDWWNFALSPVTCALEPGPGGAEVVIQNRTPKELTDLQFVHQNKLYTLKNVAPGQVSRQPLGESSFLEAILQNRANLFYGAVTARNRAFGGTGESRLDNPPVSLMALSLLDLTKTAQPHMRFESPAGTSLAGAMGAGPILFAWSADFSPLAPLNQFTPKRLTRNTFWRIAVEAR